MVSSRGWRLSRNYRNYYRPGIQLNLRHARTGIRLGECIVIPSGIILRGFMLAYTSIHIENISTVSTKSTLVYRVVII